MHPTHNGILLYSSLINLKASEHRILYFVIVNCSETIYSVYTSMEVGEQKVSRNLKYEYNHLWWRFTWLNLCSG